MSRRPPLTLLPRTACLVGAALLVAGCADTVAVDPPDATPEDVSALCADVLDDAPGTVAGQEAVRVAPAGSGRAWGSPAIVMRCGVDKPAGLEPTSRCDVVDEVGWFTQENADVYVFTTIGRRAYIEVTVPRTYDPPSDALSDLAELVQKHDPVVTPCV
ncbi:DUF3515 domain-containing protein [Mumia zhuanghuii]|uniref:DUF3515 domain-containing protein n=1 Tax=Mumia zhuanghuii TaxID=2585211 RepID=UPI001E5A4979|nr:DUF3515 domain-containing protein [Mumia zhuanghuii]